VSEDEKRVAVAVKRVFLAVAGVAPAAAAAAMGGEQDGCGASERMQIREAWVGPVCCELRHDLGCRLQLLLFFALCGWAVLWSSSPWISKKKKARGSILHAYLTKKK